MKQFSILVFFLTVLSGYAIDQSLEQKLAPYINVIVSKNDARFLTTVQEAINLVPDNNSERFVIFIRNGEYKEKIVLPRSKSNVTIVGESSDGVVLTFDDFSGKEVAGETITTNTSYSFAADANDFIAMNLTFANSAGPVGQAVALRTNGDRQFFFNCIFTAAPDVERVFLGRPWRPFARIVIINSELGRFVNPQGWSIWRGNDNHLTCYYAEYGNYGPGSDTGYRPEWSHKLSDSEAAQYTLENIFSKDTNPEHFKEDWMPDIESDPLFITIREWVSKSGSPQ